MRGTRGGVYVHRPQCCRTFECRLLQQAQRGEVTAADALTRIAAAKVQVARVRTLLAGLEPRGSTRLPLAERVANALDAAPGGAATANRRRRALATAIAALSRTIRATFVD